MVHTREKHPTRHSERSYNREAIGPGWSDTSHGSVHNTSRHTAYDHSGPTSLLLLGLIAVLAIVGYMTPRFKLLLALGMALAYVVLLLTLFDLSHILDQTRMLPGRFALAACLCALFIVVGANLARQWDAYRHRQEDAAQ